MIHEATFSDDLKVNALNFDHSTAREAIEIGLDSGCRNLILTHFSQRMAKSATAATKSKSIHKL